MFNHFKREHRYNNLVSIYEAQVNCLKNSYEKSKVKEMILQSNFEPSNIAEIS